MNHGRGWLFLIPLLTFVAAAMLLSCGGGSGSSASATPAPPGPYVEAISICPGAPASPVPSPSPHPSSSITPVPSTTVSPTPCPDFTAAAVPQGCFVQFHAVATLSNRWNVDITDASSTLWSSDNTSVLAPDPNNPGVYSAPGTAGNTANVSASASGVISLPLPVTVDSPGPCPTSEPPG